MSPVTSTVSVVAVAGCRLSRSTVGVISRCGDIAVKCSSVEGSSARTAVLGRELETHPNKCRMWMQCKSKGKGVPYSYWGVSKVLTAHLPSVGHWARRWIDAWMWRMASVMPDLPAAEHHRPLAGTKLYCLVTEAYVCKQLELLHGKH